MGSVLVATYNFDTGVSSVTRNIGPVDLSRFNSLLMEVHLTKLDSDAGDTLDVYLQETADGTNWTSRIHSIQFTGAQTPPEIWRATLQQYVDLINSPEETYEHTGSAGAAEQTADTVRNGPFPGKLLTAQGWQPNWRFRLVVVDTGGNADFEGIIRLWGNDEI